MNAKYKSIIIGMWAALLLACNGVAGESLLLGVYSVNSTEPGVVLSKVMMNSTNAGFISLEFKLSFDPAKAVLLGYEAGSQAKGLTVALNTNQPGAIYAALAGPTAVSGYGSLLQVSFKSASAAAVTLSDVQANEGTLAVAIDSSQFYPPVKPALASPVSQSIITNNAVILDWTSNSAPAVFDVYFGTNAQPTSLIASNLTLSECLSPALEKGIKYYWQVSARNPLGEVKSDVFVFSTKAAPVAKPQNIVLNEDAFIMIDLAGTDADGAALTYAIAIPSTNGILSGIAPKLTYRPATNYYGADSIEFKVNNGFYDSLPVRVSINVLPVNDAPSFVKGADQVVNEDAGPQMAKGWATAINAGPANESSQALQFEISNDNPSLFMQPPALGLDGALIYTTATNANGRAVVTVALKDDGGTVNGGSDRSVAQTFTITVNAVNDAPSFVKGADQDVSEDAGLQIVKAWATGISTGPANESSQIVQFDATNDNPSLFQQIPAISSDGTLSYATVTNISGKATVSVVLKDDGGAANGGADRSAAQTFIITVNAVNDAPSFVKGADQVANEDAGPQTVKGWATAISAGPANESSQALQFEVSNDNPSLFMQPPALGLDGTLSYTTATNANGRAVVTVALKDDGGVANGGVDRSAAQTFAITVNAVNDAPSFVKGADQAVNEDAGPQMVKAWATGISAGPANESSQTVQFELGSDNPTLFQQAPAISLDGSLSYTPAANASGKAIITVVLKDDGGVANGGADRSAVQTFVITVNGVNDAPSFAKGADQVVNEDAGPQVVKGWATAISAGPANESSQALQFEVSNDNASLFMQPPVLALDGALTYTTATNANGRAVVTVTLKDDGGVANGGADRSAAQTFTITVNAVNDAPSFVKGSDQAVNEDAGPQMVKAWATGISAGPANESSQTVQFELGSDNPTLFQQAPAISLDGSLSYTPAANASGKATVSVVLKDDGGAANGGADRSAAQTFIITVNAVNDAPSFVKGADQVVNEDAGPQMVKAWATGISAGPANESSQTVQFELGSDNPTLFQQAPAISPDGSLSYTPAANASGKATVSVVLKDDGGVANGGADRSAAQTFVITVNGINDAPSFVKGADQVVNEDAGPQVVKGWATAISAGPANESSQALQFEISNDNASLFMQPPALGLDGVLSYTTATNANGRAVVTVALKDDGGTANGGVDRSVAQTFIITVNPVNDASSFVKGADQVVNEDAGPQMVKAWATGISAGPANESSQTVQFELGSDNPTLFQQAPAISPDGSLSYTPATNASGKATVSVVLKDDGGVANGGADRSAVQTFVITVNGVNDAPSFVKGADQVVNEDAGPQVVKGWATAISAGPANESSQALQFEISNDNASLFMQPPALGLDGALSYTTATNANGRAVVTVALKDDGGTANGGVDRSAVQTFIITVNAVNDAPSFVKGADQVVNEDAGPQVVKAWATGISAGPANESSQTLQFELASDNPSLFQQTPAISADGTLSYAAKTGVYGKAVVTVILKDNGGTANGGADQSQPQSFAIVVSSVKHAPEFVKGADQIVDEDSGSRVVRGWATALSSGHPGETGHVLRFELSNDNPSLFQQQPAISPEGMLSFTTAADSNGLAVVSVTLVDDGTATGTGVDRSAAQTFRITINPVNDAPTFLKGPDQTINVGAGAQLVKNWATALIVGPANESAQTASFEVVNDNPGLFQQPPAIASDGTLSYTPAAGVSGKANVTVVMKDSGGAANGGVDRSSAQTFSISVTPSLREIRITGFARKSGVSKISWTSANGSQYVVQYRDDLRSGVWSNLDGEVTATGDLSSKDDTTAPAGKRFYRVLSK